MIGGAPGRAAPRRTRCRAERGSPGWTTIRFVTGRHTGSVTSSVSCLNTTRTCIPIAICSGVQFDHVADQARALVELHEHHDVRQHVA